MSVMHEFERRADQHRMEALKKIDAVAQEHGDDASFADEANNEVVSSSVDGDKLEGNAHLFGILS
jgi:hypothetical protein